MRAVSDLRACRKFTAIDNRYAVPDLLEAGPCRAMAGVTQLCCAPVLNREPSLPRSSMRFYLHLKTIGLHSYHSVHPGLEQHNPP